MKKWMIFGSLTGFAAGVLTGAWRGNSSDTVLWRACVAALAGGLLMRWWAKMLFVNLQSAFIEREAILEAEEAQRSAKPATQKT